MATKKAGSTAKKKTTRTSSQPAKTTVTTVRAVETSSASARAASSSRFADRRTVLAAALIGEFIGTFALTGAFLVTKGEPLYMGFVFIGLVLMLGTLSGAYFNPALTVGAWVTRKLGSLRAIFYIVAQLLGAGAAFVLLSSFINSVSVDSSSAYAQSAPSLFKFIALTDKNQWFAFGAELLGTAIVAFAFAGAWRERGDRLVNAFTKGFGLFVGGLVAVQAAAYVSAYVALNPAVALAASAIDWSKINWVAIATYLVAPLIGGILGYALRDVVDTK